MSKDPAKRVYPEFDAEVFAPRENAHCVCVFVINEGEKIQKQLKRMQPHIENLDVVICDGGSTDGSLDHDYLKAHGVRALLTKKGPGKLSAQMRMGLHHALEDGYKGVIVMDGNNKDCPSSLPLFSGALHDGHHHVHGSRFIEGGHHENTPLSRHVALKLVHAPLISWASGAKYTDTTNGFRAYSRDLLEHEEVLPFRAVFSEYELHYYLAIRSAQLGLKGIEVPTTRRYPKTGKTPTKISPLRGNLLLLKTLFKACSGHYNP